MRVLKNYHRFLLLSATGCGMSALALAIMPFITLDGSAVQKGVATVIALMFWLGLVGEILFFVLADKQCKMIEQRLIKKRRRSFKDVRIGIISFFTEPEAVVADAIAILSLIALILLSVLQVTNEGLMIAVLVTFYISFHLHCFLNGKNYKYLKEFQKYFKKQGDKKDE